MAWKQVKKTPLRSSNGHIIIISGGVISRDLWGTQELISLSVFFSLYIFQFWYIFVRRNTQITKSRPQIPYVFKFCLPKSSWVSLGGGPLGPPHGVPWCHIPVVKIAKVLKNYIKVAHALSTPNYNHNTHIIIIWAFLPERAFSVTI